MNTGTHSPACKESPHFCICGAEAASTWAPTAQARIDNADAVYRDVTGNIIATGPAGNLVAPVIDSLDAGPGGRCGTIIFPGGWSVPEWKEELPEITVKRGGIKYPTAEERLELTRTKLTAERDAALENGRFWRRQAILSGILGLAWIGVGVYYAGLALGWWS